MFCDSHAHLTDKRVYDDLEAILDRTKKAQVTKILNICADKDALQKGLELVKSHPWISNAAAVTPHDVKKMGESFFPLVKENSKNLVAIGETGLDYHYMISPAKMQQEFFQKHLSLATECNLPIIIHCRDAFDDLFAIAKEFSGKVVLHCFTGTLDEAKKVLDLGWYVSFSGIITFKKSEDLRKVVDFVPLDKMLIETDTPYLAPQSHRGKRNEPSYLPEIAEMIALIKKTSMKEVAEITTKNFPC